MGEIKLDWQSAEVKDGTLHIHLDGEASKEWKAVFERTAQLLNHGAWTEIRLMKKGEVRIKTVSEGDEERVRHFLESVVLEANSETAPPEEEDDDQDSGADTDGDGDGDGGDSPDNRMTGRFRDFGEEGSGDEQPESGEQPERQSSTA